MPRQHMFLRMALFVLVVFSAGNLHRSEPSQVVCAVVGYLDSHGVYFVSPDHWTTAGDTRLPERSQTAMYVRRVSKLATHRLTDTQCSLTGW